ncbi:MULTISPECIES: DHH family phosphoesterase [unclassified Clostridium]|uniref:DHH family phosphoesterase n=1 Tax=Clostridium TaxID=1485 RepID=UPI001C8B678C|nr:MULTISPECIES: DHH family phosphoesterase [unclassified Clostridium]MBX9136869.1 phosphoesterase [Clostridium sp. K12(2020)]MBX9143679.1 phosphoesterase [Clostridium sp. K13]MDU2290077.1 phosphoesterase [Clostridium celatum]
MRKFWESIYSPNYITGYNPFILKDMNKAIERMVSAINNRKKIVVYGIPNVDGLCAISSLILVLKYLNADIEYVVHDDSSNKSKISSKDIINNVHFLGGEILITLGIDLKSKEEEKLCKSLGIDLIVIENRDVNYDYEYIYINPNQKGCQYRYKNLSISGLTFKLMQAIAIYYNVKSINKYLDLILIGEKWTKSPKKGENSVIIKEGMRFLINTNNHGLRSIMDAYSMININDDSVDKIIDVITPTINVVTMTDNARIIIELLITNRKERAEQITKYLNKSKENV